MRAFTVEYRCRAYKNRSRSPAISQSQKYSAPGRLWRRLAAAQVRQEVTFCSTPRAATAKRQCGRRRLKWRQHYDVLRNDASWKVGIIRNVDYVGFFRVYRGGEPLWAESVSGYVSAPVRMGSFRI